MIGIEGYIFFLFKYLYLAKVRFFMNIANRGHHSEQYILRHLLFIHATDIKKTVWTLEYYAAKRNKIQEGLAGIL